VLFAIKQYQIELIKARDGVWMGEWSPLDGLSMPGIFSAYVAVTFTNSLVAAILAGVLGMAVAYGVPGPMIDLCWRQLTGRK
jgi:hypothetical protein